MAIKHIDVGLRLSPRARVRASLITISGAHLFSRRFDEAVPKLLLLMQRDPSYSPSYRYLAAACYAHMGRLDDARELVGRLRTITPILIPGRTRPTFLLLDEWPLSAQPRGWRPYGRRPESTPISATRGGHRQLWRKPITCCRDMARTLGIVAGAEFESGSLQQRVCKPSVPLAPPILNCASARMRRIVDDRLDAGLRPVRARDVSSSSQSRYRSGCRTLPR
jgi:hypothetical protein